MKLKTLIATSTLIVSSLVFANPINMNLNIVNNTPQSWNPAINDNFDNLGPIVNKNGGHASWMTSVENSKLIPFNIYYPARGGLSTYCTGNNGNFVLNPSNYKGDTINITVNGNIDAEGLTCDCTGSACDIGFVAKK